jgi:hypothetical protein
MPDEIPDLPEPSDFFHYLESETITPDCLAFDPEWKHLYSPLPPLPDPFDSHPFDFL